MQFNGKKVMSIRRKRGMSRHQVATAIGVQDISVVRWERGALPNGISMVKLLRVLNCELEDVSDD